jgi:anaerobic C4-dicarboxylate transporter DcuA
LGALSVAWRGKNLADDPGYQEKLKNGVFKESEAVKKLEGVALQRAKGSTFAFFTAVILVVFIGMFPGMRPTYETIVNGVSQVGQIEMGNTIIILMLATAGIIMILFKANAGTAVKGNIMRSGIIAVISILGISWMGSSFFEGNRVVIIESISNAIADYQWVFAVGLFVLSILLFSQAATVVTLMPVGMALGIPAPLLIAVYPAVNGYFFLPTYGTVIAAVNFDQTGTTKIGKYLVNHSFMLPGLVTTVAAVVMALILSSVLL